MKANPPPGAGMTRNAKRAFLTLLIVFAVISAAALWLGARQVGAFNRQAAQLRAHHHRLAAQQRDIRRQLLTMCQFNEDIGTAPLSVNPATRKPTKLGVSILIDARIAWRGLKCPGHLPAASPDLRHWAAVYKIPAN